MEGREHQQTVSRSEGGDAKRTRSSTDGTDFDRRHAASDQQVLAVVDGLHERDAVGALDVLRWILSRGEVDGLYNQ